MKNFLIRTASAAVFLAIVLAALLWRPEAFGIVFGFIIAVMMTEYLRITMGSHHKFAQVLSVLTGILLFAATFLWQGYGLSPKWFLVIPILSVLIFVTLLYDRELKRYGYAPYLFSSIIYIALPFSLCSMVIFRNGTFDGTILLGMMILLWASDVGAYIFGNLFGKRFGHKLFPSISPNKTWEGYIGGVILAIISAWLLTRFHMFPCGIGHSLSLAVIINVFGTLGDLAESQIKRNFGVKDTGKIMPGHGGLLDRFDGALLAFPVAVAYILIIGI